MTIHGMVSTLLLVFPWVLIGVVFVGSALSAVKRSPGRPQRLWQAIVGTVNRWHFCRGAENAGCR